VLEIVVPRPLCPVDVRFDAGDNPVPLHKNLRVHLAAGLGRGALRSFRGPPFGNGMSHDFRYNRANTDHSPIPMEVDVMYLLAGRQSGPIHHTTMPCKLLSDARNRPRIMPNEMMSDLIVNG